MSELNGYKLTARWFEFCRSGIVIIRPIHTAFYLHCVHLCNELHWKQTFGIPTKYTMDTLGISNYKTYIKTLQDLIDFGFITLVEKSSNQFTSNKIALVKNGKASPKQLPKQVQSIASVIKRSKTYKNVVNGNPKTTLLKYFEEIRQDVPRETLEIEVGKFFVKYPDKIPEENINLVNAWASKILYIKPKNPLSEFLKTEQENKRKYGSAQ